MMYTMKTIQRDLFDDEPDAWVCPLCGWRSDSDIPHWQHAATQAGGMWIVTEGSKREQEAVPTVQDSHCQRSRSV